MSSKKDAHDNWMRMLRECERFTYEPTYSKKGPPIIKIGGVMYYTARVGSRYTAEEYKALITRFKHDQKNKNKSEIYNAVPSHAYREIRREFRDNEIAKIYDNKLFESFLFVSTGKRSDNQQRLPLNLAERLYMETLVSVSRTNINDNDGTNDKLHAKGIQWRNFDNYPPDQGYPSLCVRYFHNQIRPRSGPSNKTEREAAHAKTLCIYAIKRDSATEPAEIQKKETREKRKRKAALLRDSNVFSFIPSEQRAPLFNNDIFDKNYTMYISSGAKIFNAIYIDIASAEKFPVPSGMLNDFPEVYTTCKPNPAAAIFFLVDCSKRES